jgi:hypothetical protein
MRCLLDVTPMANATESKSRKGTTTKKQTKLCLHCGRVKPLTDYYSNRDWEEQLGKDVWCRDCVNRCTTKDAIREYFWENHREWDERIWDTAYKKAAALAANNITYQKTTEERRRLIVDRLTCQQIPSVMQTRYKYIDPGKDGNALSYAEAKENGEIIQEIDPNIKVYSEAFNGYFKPAELHYLETYYQSLENDFDLDTENLRDYARKLSKASLLADKAQDDYAAGRCDFSVVKDALAQFDMLSKSANFAACKRKPGDNGGMGSWAELTYKLETSGHPCTRKIQWEPDDVDRTIAEFRYIVEALGLDTM